MALVNTRRKFLTSIYDLRFAGFSLFFVPGSCDGILCSASASTGFGSEVAPNLARLKCPLVLSNVGGCRLAWSKRNAEVKSPSLSG